MPGYRKSGPKSAVGGQESINQQIHRSTNNMAQQPAQSATQTDALRSHDVLVSTPERSASRRPLILAGMLLLLATAVVLGLYTDVLNQGAAIVRKIDTMFFIFLAGGFV